MGRSGAPKRLPSALTSLRAAPAPESDELEEVRVMGWMMGFTAISGLLLWVLVIRGIAALIKYLRSERTR